MSASDNGRRAESDLLKANTDIGTGENRHSLIRTQSSINRGKECDFLFSLIDLDNSNKIDMHEFFLLTTIMRVRSCPHTLMCLQTILPLSFANRGWLLIWRGDPIQVLQEDRHN